jgi:iron complex outermembrane receptor protein
MSEMSRQVTAPDVGNYVGYDELMARISRSALYLAAASCTALLASAAYAQDANQAEEERLDDGEVQEVVVSGQRERGAVLGNARPEAQLNAADVRALGITSVSDLLSELGPELRSASGRPPVTLLEGHRIASFREIARIPAEAIARVDILPEEVGLRYGYGADQKVMNIVLRQRFRAFNGEVDTRIPTAGDGASIEVEGGVFLIGRGERVNIGAEHTSVDSILETDRELDRPESIARTLRPAQETLTIDASYSRDINERTKATLSGQLGTDRRDSLVGLVFPGVTIPGGTPYSSGAGDSIFYPAVGGASSLGRSSESQTAELGLTVNGQRSTGQWTFTANYGRSESRGITARPFNLVDYAAAVAAGDPLANPSLPIAGIFLSPRPADLTRTFSDTANVDFIYNRSVLALPAGDVAATAKIGGSLLRLESQQERDFTASERFVQRDIAQGSLNLDFPLTSTASAIGRLSANVNGGVDYLSDAGTLRTFGAGLNWSPIRRVTLSANYTNEESAATAQQLGDPRTVTQFVPLFDYVRGESVLVTTITGGNAALREAKVENFRVGANFSVMQEPNLRLNVDYSRRRTRGGVAGFPGVTADTTLAFPDRFQRDADGRLVSVDLRPINISEQKRDVLRWGFNFSKRLNASQRQMEAMRAAFQRRGAGQAGGPQGEGVAPAAGNNGQPPAGAAPQPGPNGAGQAQAGAGARGGFGAGGPGGPGGPGGRAGGRVDFSVYHEWALVNTTQFAPTLPVLDLLDGDTLGSGSGPSRHTVEVRTGISRNGYGVRLNGQWSSATRVNGITGVPSSQLSFSDFAKVDLRAFVNFAQMPGLVEKAPFLRGARLQLGVDNVFDARQHVTDGNGAVPFAYQPAFLDPLGRTVRVSIRKLFL